MGQPMEGHIVRRYDSELSHAHLLVLELGGLVLNQTELALQALWERNPAAADTVIKREPEVDALELKADEEIVSVIARRAPMARDLRILMSISKAVTDLERIGDEAARIAAITLARYNKDSGDPSVNLLRDIHTMGKVVVEVLQEALQVFDALDVERAEALIARQTELGVEFQSALRRLTTFLLEDARNVGHTINVVLVLKGLLRIGDYAISLAQYTVYLLRGEDVRHQKTPGPDFPGLRAADPEAGQDAAD
jgi:phosphate transport system protein